MKVENQGQVYPSGKEVKRDFRNNVHHVQAEIGRNNRNKTRRNEWLELDV